MRVPHDDPNNGFLEKFLSFPEPQFPHQSSEVIGFMSSEASLIFGEPLTVTDKVHVATWIHSTLSPRLSHQGEAVGWSDSCGYKLPHPFYSGHVGTCHPIQELKKQLKVGRSQSSHRSQRPGSTNKFPKVQEQRGPRDYEEKCLSDL